MAGLKVYFGHDYNNIYDVSEVIYFGSEGDLVIGEFPVNKFVCTIRTQDNILSNQKITIYNNDKFDPIAVFWIDSVEYTSKYLIQITAFSMLRLMEQYSMYGKMYNNYSAVTLIQDIFTFCHLSTSLYTVDAGFSKTIVSGWFPEQTARQRLEQVLFSIGGFPETLFVGNFFMNIKDMNADLVLRKISRNHTYWRPYINKSKKITSLELTYYSYENRSPREGETAVWDKDTSYGYVEEKTTDSIINPSAISSDQKNIVSITDVHSDYILAVPFISNWIFKDYSIEADILIDNIKDSLKIGDFAQIETDLPTQGGHWAVKGIVTSITYTFGNKTKAHVILSHGENIDTGLQT